MGDVVHLKLAEVGDDYEIPPDEILESWKGQLKTVVLIGVNKDGELSVAGSHAPNYSLWLVEKAKKDILV